MEEIEYEEHVDEDGWMIICTARRSDSSNIAAPEEELGWHGYSTLPSATATPEGVSEHSPDVNFWNTPRNIVHDGALRSASTLAAHKTEGFSQRRERPGIETESWVKVDLPEDPIVLAQPRFSMSVDARRKTETGILGTSSGAIPQEKRKGNDLCVDLQGQWGGTLYQSDNCNGAKTSHHAVEQDEKDQPGSDGDGPLLHFAGRQVQLRPNRLDQDWILTGLSIRIEDAPPLRFLEPTRRTTTTRAAVEDQHGLEVPAEASDSQLDHKVNESGTEHLRDDDDTVQRDPIPWTVSETERIPGSGGFPRTINRLPQLRGDWIIDDAGRPRGSGDGKCNKTVEDHIPVEQHDVGSCQKSELPFSTPAVGHLVLSDGLAEPDSTKSAYSSTYSTCQLNDDPGAISTLDMYQHRRRHDDPWSVFSMYTSAE